MENGEFTSTDIGSESQSSVGEAAEFEVFLGRLLAAIGTEDLYSWGKDRRIPSSTLYNMVSTKKIPGIATLRRFREETGKPIGWLLGEDLLYPDIFQAGPSSDRGASTSAPVGPSDDFVFVPRYDGNSTDASELGTQTFSMAFRKYWVEKYLNADPANLSVYRIEDDVNEPVLMRSDNVLVDRAQKSVGDGIYALRINGKIVIRLTQSLPDNYIRVAPANSRYEPFTEQIREGGPVDIIGRVVWFGRQI